MSSFKNVDIDKLSEFIKENNIHFDEEKHSYYVGNTLIGSVSSLLKQKGVATDYSAVDEEILERARMRGTAIHLQVEEALKTGDLFEVEDEALEIVKFINEQAKPGCISLEQQVYSLNEYCPYGGRYDILIESKDDKVILYDIKTYKGWSSQKELQVKWQLSLYAYALESCGAGKIDEIGVLRFDDNKKLICQKLRLFDKSAVLLFLQKDKVEKDKYPLTDLQVATFLSILDKEEELKNLENEVKDLKEKICQYMLKEDITRAVSNDGSLELVLVKGGVTTSFDSTKFKKEEPNFYEKYQKKVVRKDYLKIKKIGD